MNTYIHVCCTIINIGFKIFDFLGDSSNLERKNLKGRALGDRLGHLRGLLQLRAAALFAKSRLFWPLGLVRGHREAAAKIEPGDGLAMEATVETLTRFLKWNLFEEPSIKKEGKIV